ncbi:MAG: HAMP domain-containing sensor histidine kinase [Ilumatobacteraceae bacterium]
MRRRITEAIVGVSALILLVLGIPLALAAHQSILDSEVVELQATAARTLTEIDVRLDPTELAAVSTEPDAPPPFSVYDMAGNLLFGDGPPEADAAVRRALAGNPASTTDTEIVVATPITDDTSERIVGALRLTESLAGADHRSRVAWLEMAATALAALLLAWLIAKRLARRLSQPVTDLADAATRLGDGGTIARPTTSSGAAEIDTLAHALTDSSERINEALARERRFSADVSHQLRTPLTGMRLRLETARTAHDPHTIELALDDLQRLEATVDHLLAFARDAIPAASTVRLDTAATEAVQRWKPRIDALGRTITTTAADPVIARGSVASIEQILDVLIDNALHHGNGVIAVTLRRIAGGGAIDVSDDGTLVNIADREQIFQRGHGDRHGIGLALARSIAEAEGGRLIVARPHPTTFSLIMLSPDDNQHT